MNNNSFSQFWSSDNSNWISNLWNNEKQELLSKALLNWLFLVTCHLTTPQMSDARGNSFTFDIWFGCPTFRPTARIEGYCATSLLFTMIRDIIKKEKKCFLFLLQFSNIAFNSHMNVLTYLKITKHISSYLSCRDMRLCILAQVHFLNWAY